MQSAAKPGQSLAERAFGVGENGLASAVAQTFLIGAMVFGLATLALTLTRVSGGPPAMWSANAVVLACLVRSSRRRWPAILIAAGLGQVAAMAMHNTPAVALGATLVDLFEAVLCAAILRFFCGRRIDLSQPRTLLVFAAVVVVGPLVSGGILASLFAHSPRRRGPLAGGLVLRPRPGLPDRHAGDAGLAPPHPQTPGRQTDGHRPAGGVHVSSPWWCC